MSGGLIGKCARETPTRGDGQEYGRSPASVLITPWCKPEQVGRTATLLYCSEAEGEEVPNGGRTTPPCWELDEEQPPMVGKDEVEGEDAAAGWPAADVEAAGKAAHPNTNNSNPLTIAPVHGDAGREGR